MISLIAIHLLGANRGQQTVLETVAIIVWGIILLKIIRMELPFNDWAEARQYQLVRNEQILLELDFSTTAIREAADEPNLTHLSLLIGQVFEQEISNEARGIKNHA